MADIYTRDPASPTRPGTTSKTWMIGAVLLAALLAVILLIAWLGGT